MFKLTRQKLLKGHEVILNYAKQRAEREDYEAALSSLEQLANIAYEYNYLKEFSDDRMEYLIGEISDQLSCGQLISEGFTNRVVFYDSFAFENRGYTQQYLYALWELGYEILFIRSNDNSLVYSKKLLAEIQQHPNTKLIVLDSNQSYESKLNFLLEQVNDFKPSKGFLHISPWDVLALLLFKRLPRLIKFQIDFTDHSFWLGKSITDKLITFRNFGTCLAYKYRKINPFRIYKIKPYPILQQNVFFEGFPVSTNEKIIAFSGGATYKILDAKNTFLNIIKRMLNEHSNLIFFFAYSGNDNFVRKFVIENGLAERFILLGNRTDISAIFNNIDIYINTYPYGGGNMIMYAANSKRPIINLIDKRLLHTHLNNVLELNGEISYEFDNEQDFMRGLCKLITHRDIREAYGQRLFVSINEKASFSKSLCDLLDNKLANASVDEEFYLDLEYLTKTHILFNRDRVSSYYKFLRSYGLRNICKSSIYQLFPTIYYAAKNKIIFQLLKSLKGLPTMKS